MFEDSNEDLMKAAIEWFGRTLANAKRRLAKMQSIYAPKEIIAGDKKLIAECSRRISDIKAGRNLQEHLGQFKLEKQASDELDWIDERLANLRHKAAIALFLSPEARHRFELTRRNLLVRRNYLLNGGNPFDDEARKQTISAEYPYEIELIEDILDQKLKELEPYSIDEDGNCPVPDDHPEKVRLEKEFEEIDDLKNDMMDRWEDGEPFTEEQLEQLFGYMTKFPTNDFIEVNDKEELKKKLGFDPDEPVAYNPETNEVAFTDEDRQRLRRLFSDIASDDYQKEQERLEQAESDLDDPESEYGDDDDDRDEPWF